VTETEPEVPSPHRQSDDPALVEFRRRTRRMSAWYAGVIAAVVLITFAAVRLAYSHGALNAVSNSTAPTATPLPTGTIAGSLTQRWQSEDHPAGGDPYGNGIVVTYSGHTVNGRDPATGKVRWHYTRSDEVVCAVVQQDGSTIALYERDGNCDQVTGFTTSSGQPKWYRTLPDNGVLAVSSMSNVVMVVSASTVHVFDNFSGLDRWTFTAQDGCTVDRALAGTLGVLTSYHCGSSYHLAAHDLTSQAETQKWTVDVDQRYVPIAAGAVFAAVGQSTGHAYIFNAANGKRGAALDLGSPEQVRVAVSGLPRSQTTVEATGTDRQTIEYVTAGSLFSISHKGKVLWSAPGTGSPSVPSDDAVLASLPAQVVQYRATDGRQTRSIAVASPSTIRGAFTAFAVGSGLLIAASNTEFYS
jgi:PQQ-like domain